MAFNWADVSISTVVNLEDCAPYRVFFEIEPHPSDEGLVQRVIDNHKFYNLILTWRESILHTCPNAVKFLYTGPWVYVDGPEFIVVPTAGNDGSSVVRHVRSRSCPKSFAASFITSWKTTLTGHIFRHEILGKLPEVVGRLPIQKLKTPPMVSDVERARLFSDFQYHIAVENCSYNNWMTEKLFDCFITKTIPIYWGCPNVGEYFNLDGILRFENYDDLTRILQAITPQTYQEKAAAIDDNYNRVLDYCKPRRLGEIIELVNNIPSETLKNNG
jgi:hypothetical protein